MEKETKRAFHPETKAIPPPFSNFTISDSKNSGIGIAGVVGLMVKREILRNEKRLLERRRHAQEGVRWRRRSSSA